MTPRLLFIENQILNTLNKESNDEVIDARPFNQE
jgi:hypothetical protein